MKIIISASKTMDIAPIEYNIDVKSELLNKNLTFNLVKVLKSLSKEDMCRLMKINNKLLDKTFNQYSNYDNSNQYQAISLYSGTVFKEVDIKNDKLVYINSHLVILSSLYGVVEPFQIIKPYRLDMHMNFFQKSLYKLWDKDVNEYFNKEIIVNLASEEYSSIIKKDMINIVFYQLKEKKLKKISYHCKVARGKMLNYMVNNIIIDINLLKNFKEDGYYFSNKMSNDKNLIFIKNL
jgi:cytoplasmic iron level regulating protein YaaA (DUF328/UPF0246 family)